MLEGAIEPKAIAKRARELGFPAAAITDRNGLYGVMEFSEACKSAGVQPIIGMALKTAPPDGYAQSGPGLLILLAQNPDGYRSLCRLSSQLATDGCHHAGMAYEDALPYELVPKDFCLEHRGMAPRVAQPQGPSGGGESFWGRVKRWFQ